MGLEKELQTAYYSALNGSITYNGSAVAVYDTVPVSPSYPYIQFGPIVTTDMSTKDKLGKEATFSLSIVDRFQGNFGSNIGIYSVYGDLYDIVRGRPITLSLTGYNLYTSVDDNALPREERTDTYTYKILEVRFRHKIEKQ